jgi:hypothetical protein
MGVEQAGASEHEANCSRGSGYRKQETRAPSSWAAKKWGHGRTGDLGRALGALGGQTCVDPFDQMLGHGVGFGQRGKQVTNAGRVIIAGRL